MTQSCATTDSQVQTINFLNPSYKDTPCRHHRMLKLLFMTPDECEFARNLLVAVTLGAIIGWERRESDRPAGIRTMALVSLGSCLFSITSAFAFIDGPMSWDSSRISAAIPSGVGFLGAGLIFKEAQKDNVSGHTNHVVHGLTTAASVWLSSAVGIACAGGLYFAAIFSVALMMTLLRFGPRLMEPDDKSVINDEQDDEPSLRSRAQDDELNYQTGLSKSVLPALNESKPLIGRQMSNFRFGDMKKRKSSPALGGHI
jgi:putative Mg2+ transporter-C (MgtC) family protein